MHSHDPWPSLFANDHSGQAVMESQLTALTRHKLERALSTRKPLRHIVLLTNAWSISSNPTTATSSPNTSPTASFYADVAVTGHASSRGETEAEEKRRQEQEWFDALLDRLEDDDHVDNQDDYVDVSLRDPLEADGVPDKDPDDLEWPSEKDFSAHTAYSIPGGEEASLSLSTTLSVSPTDSVPDLALDHGTPEASPELSSFSINDLQLVPYTAPLLAPPKPKLGPTSHPSLADFRDLRLPLRVALPIGWDLQDFGPLPAYSHGRRRGWDDIYVNLHPRTKKRPASPPARATLKASVLVQSLLLS